MSIFASFKAKNWFEGRIQTVLKNKKLSILITLILISGCFFYIQLGGIFPKCFANNYKVEGYLEHEKEWMKKIDYVEVSFNKDKNEKVTEPSMNSRISLKNAPQNEKRYIEEQLYQLVGNAPIKEMIPSILKLDQRVGAFVVGIAKKESDWGRHSPSQGGRTCYNYWGYKGLGSKGASMGYACFGNAEEAVSVVGKRIQTLVSKNINEPREMLVWKCGSSCASHDPAGVQKWVSDVSLYFGKVMQIQKT